MKKLFSVFAIATLVFLTSALPPVRQWVDNIWVKGSMGVQYNPNVSTRTLHVAGTTARPGSYIVDDDGGTYFDLTDTTILVDSDEGITVNGSRFSNLLADTVASANNLVLGYDGIHFPVSGTTTVNGISGTDWPEGAEITIIALNSFTIADSASVTAPYLKVYCSGGSNVSMTAGDHVKFMKRASVWRQTTPVVALVN